MSEVNVARAGVDDCTALAPLFEAYRRHFTGADDPAGSRAFLAERLARGDSVVYLAGTPERIAGFIQLYPLFSSWYVRPLWFLSDLFVDPSARGHGVARALIARVEEHARETGAKGLLVEIPFSEPKLIGLYESAGYRKDAVFDVYRLGVGAHA